MPSTAWLAYGLADVVQLRRLIDTSEGDATHRRRLSAHLDAMLALCETVECRRVQMLAYFGEESEPCGNCDTCLEPPQTWDGTVAAQKLLSTIVRLERERGQRYGAGHLIDILLGKTTPRVAQLGHGTLSVFGVGADLSDGDWRGVVRQLLAQGLVGVSADGYGTLQVTATSDAVLSGARQVPLRRAPVRPPRATSARRTGAAAATADLDPTQTDMFERLRGWRAATAKEQGVPAYVVFHDATLRELALRLPTTLDELGTVSGIGAAKVDRYGTQVLEALRA